MRNKEAKNEILHILNQFSTMIKIDRNYNDLFQSIGLSVAVTTLIVSIGKAITPYYFYVIIFFILLLLFVFWCVHYVHHEPIPKPCPMPAGERTTDKRLQLDGSFIRRTSSFTDLSVIKKSSRCLLYTSPSPRDS